MLLHSRNISNEKVCGIKRRCSYEKLFNFDLKISPIGEDPNRQRKKEIADLIHQRIFREEIEKEERQHHKNDRGWRLGGNIGRRRDPNHDPDNKCDDEQNDKHLSSFQESFPRVK